MKWYKDKQKQKTNFQRITASPEALAEFIFYIFSQICNDNICEECAAEWCKNKQGFKKADVVDWLKQESETMEKQEVVFCKDCKYKVERHYEENGEKPYVKLTCGNFRGLNPKYRVMEFDFCSRGEQESTE